MITSFCVIPAGPHIPGGRGWVVLISLSLGPTKLTQCSCSGVLTLWWEQGAGLRGVKSESHS